jgi:hypothetical protein
MLRFSPFSFVLGVFACAALWACAARPSADPQQPGQPGGYPPPSPGAVTPSGTAPPAQPGYAQPPTNGLRPAGGEGDDFGSVADAERELERARAELSTLGVSTKTTAEKGQKKPEEPEPLAKGNASCGNACRAFASLQRAANAVCRLTSEGDARCVRARTVVKENETRVSVCGCEPPKG